MYIEGRVMIVAFSGCPHTAALAIRTGRFVRRAAKSKRWFSVNSVKFCSCRKERPVGFAHCSARMMAKKGFETSVSGVVRNAESMTLIAALSIAISE